jgi:hypothetical protein
MTTCGTCASWIQEEERDGVRWGRCTAPCPSSVTGHMRLAQMPYLFEGCPCHSLKKTKRDEPSRTFRGQSHEPMRLAVIQYIRRLGRWELQYLTTLTDWMGGDPDLRVVTIESLLEDYGISPGARSAGGS